MSAVEALREALAGLEMVDLSQPLAEDMPIWRDHSRYYRMIWGSYEAGGTNVTAQLLLNEHNGSHVDAPAHYVAKGPAHLWIDQVPLQRHLGPYTLYDLTDLEPQQEVTVADLRRAGPVPDGDIVLLRYGWGRLWTDRDAYVRGWPGLGGEAAAWLADRVPAVGVDTISVDVYDAEVDHAHVALLERQVAVYEQLNLDGLPPRGFFLGLPLRIQGGSGSPVRAVALVERG